MFEVFRAAWRPGKGRRPRALTIWRDGTTRLNGRPFQAYFE